VVVRARIASDGRLMGLAVYNDVGARLSVRRAATRAAPSQEEKRGNGDDRGVPHASSCQGEVTGAPFVTEPPGKVWPYPLPCGLQGGVSAAGGLPGRLLTTCWVR
jgi:hypothetical protein